MMKLAKMKFAIDDGSTNVKISWIDKGAVQSLTSPNSFRKDWKSAALLNNSKIFNYQIGSTALLPGLCDRSTAVALA